MHKDKFIRTRISMKKDIYLRQVGMTLLLTFAIVYKAGAQEQSRSLTLDLDKAIEIALSENPTIKVADIEITRKDYSRKGAIGNLFPTITASGDYSRTLKKQVMYMDMDIPGMDNGMKVGQDNSYSMGFNFQLPIVAPTFWKNIQLSKADIEQTLESARASRLSLVDQVKKAYYNVMMSEDSYQVLKESYDNACLNAKDFRNKYEHGVASEYDVLRAEVQVRTLEPGLLQAENGVKLSKVNLKVLLGLDMNIEVTPANKLSDYEADMYEQALNIDTSLQNNTNLKQLDLQADYLKKALVVQKMSWYPTLTATGLYNWTSMSNGPIFKDFRWNPYSMIGLTLSIPIFQGGSRYYKVKDAQLTVNQMKFRRQDLVRNLQMQSISYIDNIQKSIKQIASNKEGVRQAEKAYSIMQKKFEIGAATFIEVNDANVALTNARLSYYQAIHDYLAAKSDLEQVTGNVDLSKYMKNQQN